MGPEDDEIDPDFDFDMDGDDEDEGPTPPDVVDDLGFDPDEIAHAHIPCIP